VTDAVVLYEASEKIGVITLNRPDSLNAISKELRLELTAAFRRADDDPAVTVVVLRANGRSFCAGYDISAGGGDKEAWRHDALKWHAHLAEELEFEMIPWYMKKPVIASVQGHALGGGCELTMFCDLTIAADNALFGEPEVRFSDVGPAIIMPWLVGYKKARELLYFGDMITAAEALGLGMVNRVVPLAELPKVTMKFARRLALIAPEALYAAKIAISRGADVAGFRNAMQAGLDMMGPLYAAKSEVGLEFSRITREQGLRAALQWRRGQFDAVDRE
jgi:enoyl-CoA hydratase/carnithine racemase